LKSISMPISLKLCCRNSFIGSDSMLIAPVRIGRGAVTGAGAVVNKDVPPGGVAVGVPAKVIKYVPADVAR